MTKHIEYWRWENEVDPKLCKAMIELAEDNWSTAETDTEKQNTDIRKGKTFFTSQSYIYDLFFPYMRNANNAWQKHAEEKNRSIGEDPNLAQPKDIKKYLKDLDKNDRHLDYVLLHLMWHYQCRNMDMIGDVVENESLIDFEASLNMYGNAGFQTFDSAAVDGSVRAYRLWGRYSTEQFEFRLGLQKIDFYIKWQLKSGMPLSIQI